jgi:hypothetical protein
VGRDLVMGHSVFMLILRYPDFHRVEVSVAPQLKWIKKIIDTQWSFTQP